MLFDVPVAVAVAVARRRRNVPTTKNWTLFQPRSHVRIKYIERGLLDMTDSIDTNVDLRIRFGT